MLTAISAAVTFSHYLKIFINNKINRVLLVIAVMMDSINLPIV